MGVTQLLLAAAAGIVRPFIASTVVATAAPGVLATASRTFNSDGSITSTATPGDGGSSIGSTSWHLPNAAGVGNPYFVRFTPTSGTFTTNDATGFVALSSARSCSKSSTAGGASVTYTVDIALDVGGANIVLTSVGNVLSYNHV